jgi:transposase
MFTVQCVIKEARRRWLVERFFAWIQWQRRILVRWEYHAQNFLGFVQLACLVVLFRRF